MYWIVENNLFKEPFYDKLLPFLDKMEIPYETNRVIPFGGGFLEEPKPTQENVIVIGSYSMSLAAVEKGWVPGTFVNENFDYRVWSREWEGRCLNSPAEVTKFGEVREQEDLFFIRPCTDDKQFTGHVKDWKEFAEWQKKVIDLRETYTTLDYDTPVLVSEPKRIEAEYRFIVIDGEVITGSLYKQGQTVLYQECTDPGIYQFVQETADIWVPARGVALDICIHDGELYVLEMGNMNAAGLYACDVQKLVMALEDMRF